MSRGFRYHEEHWKLERLRGAKLWSHAVAYLAFSYSATPDLTVHQCYLAYHKQSSETYSLSFDAPRSTDKRHRTIVLLMSLEEARQNNGQLFSSSTFFNLIVYQRRPSIHTQLTACFHVSRRLPLTDLARRQRERQVL